VKPISIALIRSRYAQDGGAERFVARALEALKTQNVQLTLVTRGWTRGAGFEVMTCNPFYIGRLWRDWSFARCVCWRLAEKKFDLVQSHERIACCDLYRAGDGVHREWLQQRARTLGWIGKFGSALNPYHHYVKAAEKALFTSPQLKAVICNSRMVRDEIKHYFGTADEKLHVIYSGVDTQAYHPDLKKHRAAIRAQHGIPSEVTLFLFVGSGFVRKGVPVLLEAMSGLPGNACLLVVGRDKNMSRFRERAQALGLSGRVFFAGAQADVKPYYGAADALVLPTLYDPFPNVALEAMAAGLPLITSTKCGAAELIENGKSGFVCDALDRAGLEAAMKMLLSADKQTALGRAARQTVEPFTLDNMAGELVKLYKALL
jgi:UDP-glucose:(heptosyl)LPS alpha-1,3-glucosyltransferase